MQVQRVVLAVCALVVLIEAVGAEEIRPEKLWRHETGVVSQSAGEMLAYDVQTRRLFVTNCASASVEMLSVEQGDRLGTLSVADLGCPTCVAAHGGLVAVTVSARPKVEPGHVVFFKASTGVRLAQVCVGSSPDMVVFCPNGQRVLVANEGEPSQDYCVDPEGSVTVLDISEGVENVSVKTAIFRHFNRHKRCLVRGGVRIFGPSKTEPDGVATVAQDCEPEFITISSDSKTAWVSLQENNAIALVDIEKAKVRELMPMGFKDHNRTGAGLDASDRDQRINITEWPVRGMYQPDALAVLERQGKTFLVTVNEGDSRPFEEARVGDDDIKLEESFLRAHPNIRVPEKLGRLKITTSLGDEDGNDKLDELYCFGARSFSVWEQKKNQLSQVFDSGDGFEKITAQQCSHYFNADNSKDRSRWESRSDDKGPEPEGLAIGQHKGHVYAFIGLERVGGIVVYDLTEPLCPEFLGYWLDQNPSNTVKAQTDLDLGPEGLVFIAADENPLGCPLLAVANEVSGSTTVYRLTTDRPK